MGERKTRRKTQQNKGTNIRDGSEKNTKNTCKVHMFLGSDAIKFYILGYLISFGWLLSIPLGGTLAVSNLMPSLSVQDPIEVEDLEVCWLTSSTKKSPFFIRHKVGPEPVVMNGVIYICT